MTWTPRYMDGKIAIVPDDSEDFVSMEIEKRIRTIEERIRVCIQTMRADPEADFSEMFRIFSAIHGLFGVHSFIVRHGAPVAESADVIARVDALCIETARLNAELDARRGAAQ